MDDQDDRDCPSCPSRPARPPFRLTQSIHSSPSCPSCLARPRFGLDVVAWSKTWMSGTNGTCGTVHLKRGRAGHEGHERLEWIDCVSLKGGRAGHEGHEGQSLLSKFSTRHLILQGTISIVRWIIPIFYSHPRGPTRPACPRFRLSKTGMEVN